jgi:hypothetical protein
MFEWDTQVICPQVHHVWATYAMEVIWLGYVARLTHVMNELIAYETWYGVMWLRWRRSRQDLALWTGCKCKGQVGGFRTMDRVVLKLKQDLAPMDKGNCKKQVRSRLMNEQDHVMIWSGSYHLWYGWCMCCINIGGDGMECIRQRYYL